MKCMLNREEIEARLVDIRMDALRGYGSSVTIGMQVVTKAFEDASKEPDAHSEIGVMAICCAEDWDESKHTVRSPKPTKKELQRLIDLSNTFCGRVEAFFRERELLGQLDPSKDSE